MGQVRPILPKNWGRSWISHLETRFIASGMGISQGPFKTGKSLNRDQPSSNYVHLNDIALFTRRHVWLPIFYRIFPPGNVSVSAVNFYIVYYAGGFPAWDFLRYGFCLYLAPISAAWIF